MSCVSVDGFIPLGARASTGIAITMFTSHIFTRLLLGLRPANERRRYKVTPCLIGWAQTNNQPCIYMAGPRKVMRLDCFHWVHMKYDCTLMITISYWPHSSLIIALQKGNDQSFASGQYIFYFIRHVFWHWHKWLLTYWFLNKRANTLQTTCNW